MSRESRSCRSTNVLIKTTDGVLSRNRRIVFFSDGSSLRSEASTSTKADDALLCPTTAWTNFCGSISPDGTNAVVPSNIAAPVTAIALRHRDRKPRQRDVFPSDSGPSEQARPVTPCRSPLAPCRYVLWNSRAALVPVPRGTTHKPWRKLPGCGGATTKPDTAASLWRTALSLPSEAAAIAARPTRTSATRARQRALVENILLHGKEEHEPKLLFLKKKKDTCSSRNAISVREQVQRYLFIKKRHQRDVAGPPSTRRYTRPPATRQCAD